MRLTKTRLITGLALLLMVVGMVFASTPMARPDDHGQPLELPSPLCDRLQVEAGNQLALRMYARGVQIYRWNGSTWQFVAPSATLLADPGYHAQVGIPVDACGRAAEGAAKPSDASGRRTTKRHARQDRQVYRHQVSG